MNKLDIGRISGYPECAKCPLQRQTLQAVRKQLTDKAINPNQVLDRSMLTCMDETSTRYPDPHSPNPHIHFLGAVINYLADDNSRQTLEIRNAAQGPCPHFSTSK